MERDRSLYCQPDHRRAEQIRKDGTHTAWSPVGVASGVSGRARASSAHALRTHALTRPNAPPLLPVRASRRRRCGGGGGARSIADCSRRRAVVLPEAAPLFHVISGLASPADALAGGGAVPGAAARTGRGLQLVVSCTARAVICLL